MNIVRRAYHWIFHRWAVVEIQSNGTIQIVSTHMLWDIASGMAVLDHHVVIRRVDALARIARG